MTTFVYLIGSLAIILGGGFSCGTDLPTSGQEIWGRNEDELQLISIGTTLTEIVADPQRPYLYAADFDNSLIYIISSGTQQIEKSLAVGSRPSDLALSMDGNRLYVALLGGAEVAIVDLDLQEEVDRIPLTFSPAYVVSGRPPYLYVSATLELSDNFEDDGETRLINEETGKVEKVIPPVGLMEVNATRSRFYIGVLDRIFQYDITDGVARYKSQEETEGPIVEMHLSEDGSRIYTISAGPLTGPDAVISHGLIDSRANVDVNMVEVFDTNGLVKIGELHTGAFPRAIASSGDRIAVAVSDLSRSSHSSGFVVTFDATTLKTMETHRLVGTPTGCAVLDANTDILYVAVDNPYDIRERFGDRQDLQLVPLGVAPEPAGGDEPSTEPDLSGRPKEIVIELPGGVTMEMVWIESGSFMMGAPEEEAAMIPEGQKASEYPIHEVTISRGFYLGKHEFTMEQWEAVMGTRPWAGQNYVIHRPNHPAVYISWDDSQEMIQRLNELEGQNLYRMPTEAEWEYACRAGTRTRWSFGNQMGMAGDYAWHQWNTWEKGEPYGHPVGTRLPNPWGLFDMHGNVWEWVQDWLGKYPEEAQVDPTGPETGLYRVVRSSIFMAPPPAQRSAYRLAGAQDFPDGGVGVRLLRQEPIE